MPYISTFDLVRVVQLNDSNRQFIGTAGVARAPQVGDIGTVVFGDSHCGDVQVESVTADGLTGWLAEFSVSELEWLHGTAVGWDQLPTEAFEITNKLKIGMARSDVLAILGDPDDVGGTPNRGKIAAIFKYGRVELHFDQSEAGNLRLVYMEDGSGIGITLLQ